jgi:hypothetical protein
VGPEVIQEMEDEMQLIRKGIKEVKYHQKSYLDPHRTNRSYEIGDKVFFWLKSHKSSIKFVKSVKLSPRFVGPFEGV